MKRIILTITVLLVLTACSTLRIERPPESYTEAAVAPKFSTLNIPFHFEINNLERMLNKQLTGMIYADTSFDDNNQDDLMIRAWKKDDIHIRMDKNEFRYSIPLRVWINKRFSIGSFGFSLSDSKAVNAEILLKFRTTVAVNKNWTISTTTLSDGYEWISTPQIRLGAVSVPIPYLSDLIVNANLSAVNAGIDKALQNMVDIRKTVQKVWTDLQAPIRVSDDYPLWAKVTPVEVSMLPLQGNAGLSNPVIGFTAITELYYNEIPEPGVNALLPDLKITSRLDDEFNINLAVKVPFTEINQLARQQLTGYTLNQGYYHIRIKDLFFFGSGDKLVVALHVEGSLNGTVYLAGKPYYDKDSSVVRIRDPEFDIRTRNVLVKSASWVYHQGLIKLVRDQLSYPVGGQLSQVRQLLQAYLGEDRKLDMFRISGRIDKLDIEDFQITKKSVNVLCVFGGKISVSLNDE
jgi:hypothetical protein